MDYDILITGGGVVGLVAASVLAEKGLKIVLAERHPSFGYETSSRNSEVIHAGIYYPENSLKAKLCVTGNKSLYSWCEKYKVPFNKIGKFIVAVNKDEEEDLENLFNQANLNGVDGIFKVTENEIKKKEPNVKAYSALWSPSTGIIDSHKLMESLYEKAKDNDVDFAWNHAVINISNLNDGYEVTLKTPDCDIFSINCKSFINAAGLDCDTIAGLAGINIDDAGYRLQFVRGHYFRINSSKKSMVKHLIYPRPQKKIYGLGIHVTIDMNGELKLGPDVEYLSNRVQDYSVSSSLKDKFYLAASQYLPELKAEDIYPDQAGIRPKLISEGGVFRDFIIKEESDRGLPGLINLIGIESPGLTSCLEIARMVAEYL